MNPKFGPREQTREQRQALFSQAAAINATQDRFAEPFAVELCRRYVDGELTLAEVLAEVQRVYQARYAGGTLVTTPAAPAVAVSA